MASPVGGMQLDPKLMMLLQQHPELLQALGGGGGMPPGGMPPPGGGMPAMGGTPPLGMPPGGPPPMPGSGMPGANSVPGLTPVSPAPGGQSQFGPPPGAPQPPMPPSGGMAPPPSPGGPPGMNPQLQAVNMTLGQAAFGGPERALDRQTKLADELRSEAAPGMRGGSGRVQTAANPLEFAATAYNRIGGQAMSDRTEEKRQALFEERMRKLRGDMGIAGPIE